MSALSRAGADVQRAMAGWEWGREEQRRREIEASRPLTRAQRIADIRRGLETADQIVCDIQAYRASRRSDPLRWAIGFMKDGDRLSMLVAQLGEIDRLLRDVGADAGRAATP
jgi:hypothetical protein